MNPSWIDEIVKQHEEFEPPLNFWRWSAIASISAVVKDTVWLDRQIFNLYPNIYVMFHADSGLKKGPPVNMAKRLVKAVNNTRIISGRSSIQGILKKLGDAYTTPGGHVVNKAVAFICSSELSSSIVEDKVATTILTDLYDRQYNVGEWQSLLKMETFDLKDPTITMLTATNEAHSDDFFMKKDITGGYFARTFIIHESEGNRSNSLSVPLKTKIDYDKSAQYLKSLTKISGPFQSLGAIEKSEDYPYPFPDKKSGEVKYYSEAGILFESWYNDFDDLRKTIKDSTGTLNRFDSSVLKVAMLLSLARAPTLIIDPESMAEAIVTCEKLLGNIRRITLGKTGGSEATDAVRKTIFIQELLERQNHAISRVQLLKKYWMQGTVKEWDDTILSFTENEVIKEIRYGNQIVYEMTEKSIVEFKEFFGGKMK